MGNGTFKIGDMTEDKDTRRADGAIVAEDCAQEVLDSYWQSGRLPIDPAQIAAGMGIGVFEKKFPPTISGVIFKDPEKDPTIVLNAVNHRVRKRFTCAHEIGHFAQHAAEEELEYVDFRNEVSSDGTDEDERFANAFAANLLMPRAAVKEKRDEGLTAMQMAKVFDVSLAAMEFRLNNLGMGAE